MHWLQNLKTSQKLVLSVVILALLGASYIGFTMIPWPVAQRSSLFGNLFGHAPSSADRVVDKNMPNIDTANPLAVSPSVNKGSAVPQSCPDQKKSLTEKYNADVAAENANYKATQNKIMEEYSSLGLAFSLAQKRAQKIETARHTKLLYELEVKYQAEIKKLNC